MALSILKHKDLVDKFTSFLKQRPIKDGMPSQKIHVIPNPGLMSILWN